VRRAPSRLRGPAEKDEETLKRYFPQLSENRLPPYTDHQMRSEHATSSLLCGADLEADVLKVGHHGSAYSSTPAFITAIHRRSH
jgi:hypothetical protein